MYFFFWLRIFDSCFLLRVFAFYRSFFLYIICIFFSSFFRSCFSYSIIFSAVFSYSDCIIVYTLFFFYDPSQLHIFILYFIIFWFFYVTLCYIILSYSFSSHLFMVLIVKNKSLSLFYLYEHIGLVLYFIVSAMFIILCGFHV